MPDDQQIRADAVQRQLLAEQRRTNELLAKADKRAGFSWVRVAALLAVILIIMLIILL